MKIPHIARNTIGNRSYMNDYPRGESEVAVGDFVTLTDGAIERVTGADPTDLLGIAKSHTGTGARGEAVDPTRILVEHFDDTSQIWMEGTRAPTEADKGLSFGLVIDPDGGTHYVVDAAETVNTRVYVADVDVSRAAWFVLVLAANRQSLVGV